jgi:uncharacterized protein with HEPN domain
MAEQLSKHRDELVFLDDIAECCERIEEYIGTMTEEEFDSNIEKQDAVLRRIEIMGEAVKHISSATKERYPNVPWRQIAAMRNIVINQYFGLTTALVWRVAANDIPNLKAQIQAIIADMLR